MQIKRTKVVEFYEVVIPDGENDSGNYAVKRELCYESDVYFEVNELVGRELRPWTTRSRPYKSITKEIERQRQKRHERTVKRQARLLEGSTSQQ